MSALPPLAAGRYLLAIDGGYLSHVSDYYRYHHHLQSRLNLLGLRRFVRGQMASLLGVASADCHEERCSYFRGRLSDALLQERGRLVEQRTFEAVLGKQGLDCHWLPVNPVGEHWREKGCDVALAVTTMDQVFKLRPEGLALVAGDGDYTPLVHLLKSYHIKVMLLAWNLQYRAHEPGRNSFIKVATSRRLCGASHQVLQMEDLIEDGLSRGLAPIQDLFLPPRRAHITLADPLPEPASEAAE
jgi:uncharacterized LabA/DUF88 family protein